jgi:hypothetical protein
MLFKELLNQKCVMTIALNQNLSFPNKQVLYVLGD